MPGRLALTGLPAAEIGGERWRLPLGVTHRRLEPAVLDLHDGDHALVVGPARSGRTTTLVTLAAVVRAAAPDTLVVAVAGRRSALARVHGGTVFEPASAGGAVTKVEEAGCRRTLLLIDDAERVEDPDGRLTALLSTTDHPFGWRWRGAPSHCGRCTRTGHGWSGRPVWVSCCTIDGGLQAAIDSLHKEGTTLMDPSVWDGRLAGQFRSNCTTTPT